jgi:hypothetical protein
MSTLLVLYEVQRADKMSTLRNPSPEKFSFGRFQVYPAARGPGRLSTLNLPPSTRKAATKRFKLQSG